MRRLTLALTVLAPLAALIGAPAAGAGSEELYAAARAGDLETVRRLVEEAGVAADTPDRYGTTPLAMAAANGHPAVAEYLLDRGADPDRADSFYGATPLTMAFFNGHPEVATLLLRRGAEGREQALESALTSGDVELARAAVEGGPIHASRLAALRERAAALNPEIAELLAGATSRPDPEPPVYSVAELHRYTGVFEGWTNDTRVEVDLREGRLRVAVDGESLGELEVVAENSFKSADGTLRTAFSGRAGTIEGLQLMRRGTAPDYLRRSVAEPVGAAALADAGATPAPASIETVHWPQFRGVNASGIGDGTDAPVAWDLETGDGVLWQTPLPGLGNASPIVWGDRVYVATAVADEVEQTIRTGLTGSGQGVEESVEHSWRVLALDKASGAPVWETEIARAVPLTRRHFKATQANSTPVTDGKRLVVVFPTAGLACLDLVDGKVLWKQELGGLNAGAFTDPGQEWGFASSPILHGSKVILQVDVHGGQYLAAWDLESGEQLWRTERRVAPSWATPALLTTAEGGELIVNGSTIHAYDPDTGEELWSLGPNSELVIATPVVGDGVVYVSAGYPPVKPIYAVPAGTRGALEVDPGGGDPRLLWSHERGGAYMPTPLLYRGLLYVVHHNGRIVAYNPRSGDAVYKKRFSMGGAFTGSPVAVNGKLYVPTEEGLVYVLEAGAEYRELAVNEMGEPLMATPAVSEGMLFLRTPTRLVALANDAG